MHILLAASECAPFFKTGGLGDVVQTLPKSIVKQGHHVMVVLPLHDDIEGMEFVCCYDIYVGDLCCYCGVFTKIVDGVVYYFIDNKDYFNRCTLYGYDDDVERYAYFDFAVLELISHLQLQVDVLSLHDWQTAMIAALYKERYCQYDYYKNIKVLLTIHNIAYQGKCLYEMISLFGLKDVYDHVTQDGLLNCLKAGIVYSDEITTVSPNYAKEIQTVQYGEGLHDLLRYKQNHVTGILNGLDYRLYRLNDTKVNCKRRLIESFGLEDDLNKPIFCMVSRLTDQKGLDLVLGVLPSLLQKYCSVVILGSGDSFYEHTLNELSNEYEHLKVWIGYNEQLANLIYAGSDYFLMPSKFEPCGIAQMIAMSYGTVPIVRATGGLVDTVIPYHEGSGTGLMFYDYTIDGFNGVLQQAFDLYYSSHYIQLKKNAVDCCFDFDLSAKQYIELFNQ